MSKNDTPVPVSASLNALRPGSAAIPLCILASPLSVADLRGGAKAHKFLSLMHFSENLAKSYVGPPAGGLAPPPTRNPGSAPDYFMLCTLPVPVQIRNAQTNNTRNLHLRDMNL